MKTKKYSILIAITTLTLMYSTAQTGLNSPYSRYGIGNLQNRNNVSLSSMGGLNKSIGGNTILNHENPATYSLLDTLAFVFDAALFSNSSILKSSSTSITNNNTSLSYFTIGFSIIKKIKSSFGILPYSDIGYTMIDKQNNPSIGTATYIYEGDGGLTKIYGGLSFQILKNLSIGANASYVFGNIWRTRKIEFDTLYAFNTLNKTTNHISGFMFDFGAIFTPKISEDKQLNIGLTYSLNSKLKSTDEIFSATYVLNTSDEEVMRDTVELYENAGGEISIPQKAGFGISFEKPNKYLIGVDVEWQNWRNYKLFGESDSLQNSLMINVGGMFSPNPQGSSIFKRAKYRLGFKYVKSYLELKNTQINDMSISAGISLPIRKSMNSINIGFEIGQFGTINNNLIRINYYNIQIGIQFYERWFYRRKLN